MPRPLDPRGKNSPGTHWIGSWVDLRTGFDDAKNREILLLPALELRSLGLLARSQSLYRLRRHGYSELDTELTCFVIKIKWVFAAKMLSS
jgi:hypothetical protein